MSLLRRHSSRKSSILKKSRSKSQDVEYTALDIPSLRRRRTIAYKRMSKALEVGVSAVNDHSQRDMFFSYHQEIKKIASDFEEAHFAILEILDDPDNDNSEMQEHFDEMYYKVISIYRSLNKIESCAPQPPSSSLSNVRLPKIQLPTFTGDIKRFPEYFDTFNALIHNSTSLSDTEKFHYLISSLSGDASTVVKTFPLSSEYYRDAYAALIERYQCKRELAFTCWREILTMNFNFKDAYEFRKSLDLFEENLCILKSVNLPVNNWDFVLVYHLLSKLDTNLRRDFEEKHSDTELPSYSQLKKFLHSKCEALLRDTHFTEQAKQNKTTQKVSYQSAQSNRVPTSHALIAANGGQSEVSSSIVTTRPVTCSFCNDSHSISSCPEFLKMPIDERMKIATDRNWCFNCLKSSHQLRNCSSIFSCRTCKRKHHSLLHRQTSNEPSETVSALVSRSQSNTTILLATAIVQVRDASGKMQSFRALFDTGSQGNFITESAVKRLNLKQSRTAATVSGLGESAASILGDVTCSIGTSEKLLFELDLHVLSKICGDQPIANLNTSGWSHIKTLPLADPSFDITGPIDLLFAADVFAESLLDERIKGSSNQPTAIKSVFGWLLLGKTGLATTTLLQSSETKTNLSSLEQRLWKLESSPWARPLSPNESLCEQKLLISDHSHDKSGRYILRLPFKEDSEPFDGSRDVVLRRFHAIERRLSRDLNLYSQYTNVIADCIDAAQMSLVPSDDLEREKYYIPHHCPESATIYTPVVFDASTKALNSCSLNDTQLIGLKLQPNIVEILMRFREHNIVFMADARQICRQILISPEHRNYQRIFWRASPHEPLKKYRFNTVTHSIDSFPLLAFRISQQLVEVEDESYSVAKKIILSDVSVVNAVYIRSDLTITLWCLLFPFTQRATIVAYRISRIQDITPTKSWHQISSGDNPAGIICLQGQFLSECLHNPSWWAGPRWLSKDHDTLPSNQGMISSEKEVTINTETRKAVVLVTKLVQDTEAREAIVIDVLQNCHSSLQKPSNALNYSNLFVNNSRNQLHVNQNNLLNNVEQHNALIQTLKHIRSQAFPEEISNINEPFLKQFRKRDPFLDSRDIRVGGRISQSGLEYEQNYPTSLPSDHRLTVSILDFIHRHHYQPGINTTHFLLLQQFWIFSAKRVIRRDLSKCLQYYRSRPQPLKPFMSNLPPVNRTRDSKLLKIESMVIIKNEIRAPLHCSFGRLTNIIPGVDEVTWIVVLRTATNNQIQRPLVKLCSLPTED